MAINGISMGTKSLTLFLALVTFTCLLSSTTVEARDIIVGDDSGWTLNGFNYTAWAQGQKFAVGDNLVFKYDSALHDVYMVGGIAFKNCSTEKKLASFNTGNDIVPLSMAGNMWFLCSVSGHCENGMKFKITVVAAETSDTPTESPTATPPTTGGAPSLSSAASTFILLIFAGLAISLL
ncbi:hypothetical protein KI387_005081 [Taxus chinensis]|uniref:Phytocyanin domain-containing protein n=1 Tax=Taxus chinensis TaxID=29808 RepID=A0AA38LHB2_TAXCH|nr:hypothetical protein KI387_005081 [Taxus chinensis]